MARERTDYPLNYGNGSQLPHDRPHDLADAVTDRVKEVTDNLQERAGQVEPFVQKSLKEKPMTTLASFVLVGFVLGAMWKK